MPKKEKEITLLPKKKVGPKIPVTFLEKVLWVVVIIVLAIWGGQIYYKKTLEEKTKDLTNLVEKEIQKRDIEEEDKLIFSGSRLESLAEIVPAHLYWTKIFEKVQEKTVPKIWFSDFQAKDSGKMVLKGFAVNHSNLAYQFVSFRDDPDIEEVNLSDIRKAQTGEVSFTFTLLFKPEALIKK